MLNWCRTFSLLVVIDGAQRVVVTVKHGRSY